MKHMTPTPFLYLLALATLTFSSSALASNDPEEVFIDDGSLLSLSATANADSAPVLPAVSPSVLPAVSPSVLPAVSPSVLPELRLSAYTDWVRELQKKPEAAKTEEVLDPTDVMQFMTSARIGLEFNDLANGEGSNSFLRAQGNMALNPKMLLHAELPIGWSNLSHHSSDAGFGDLRLAFYYLAKRDLDNRKLFQGAMPGVEIVLPTGNATKGLGGDAGLLMPYFNVKMQVGQTVTISNVFRYVHSFSRYRAAGNPDINVPSASKGRDTQDGKTVREIWWQIPVIVKPEDMWLTWMTFTPDMAWNFHDKTTRSYRLDFEAGKSFKEDFSVAANLTIPLNSQNTIDWIFGIQAIIAF